MSLAEQSQKWFPTHVQATVLQASGLQPKGKNGTNDAYTIIQLGKEKYSTSVAEKTASPVWKEEASFELPGLLVEGNPEVYVLCLTVMHRSLVGMDKFLGQKTINLNEIFDNKQRKKTDWYSLESRPGKKRKERGRIEVSIQFMRNNMTASMFDLSMKEKPRSPFSKLKSKVKGRKNDGGYGDTSSAILPRSAVCDPEPGGRPAAPQPESKPEAKAKRPLLSGGQKLSAAHSMSDLIGGHVRPKLNSINSVEESGTGGPHRRSQSEVPGYQDGGAHSDPFTDISDTLPQKYATLPRNRNPFEGERGQQPWDRAERKEKKEKVSLLERVTGKKEGRKAGNGGRSGSSGDLRSPNPFSADSAAETNPFTSGYKTSDKKFPGNQDGVFGQKKKKDFFSKKNDAPQDSAANYSNLTFEEVVQELIKQKEVVRKKDAHIRELEDYIDNLLVRVMEETPSILRTPYEPKKKAGKLSKK
ncbi:rab11 family-interacting protein 2 isoform X1 [Fundulus heteroclitus]|uniref:rab11 family-interacting protein 2 isoform X1 n=1 Tax=Fundulus heteroclitus TaxID=8078 RepID=UPI00165C5599|nr:rab11 family-interacting protein 2 isoform X1 [Fundulus heteroclitus]XP_035981970.1 rab11 family-interacting protein 2 isoform X1 [Fundulus heteroclitus]XP_035981971.1 rab11 family-interacting protein 2 isoform X1 [Fundulus heteroclitus]